MTTLELLIAGDLMVDPRTRRVTMGKRRVTLSPKEYDLLCCLAAEPTRVFTKDEIIRDVWGDHAPGSRRALDAVVGRLRRKLDHRYVHTAWGVGFSLVTA